MPQTNYSQHRDKLQAIIPQTIERDGWERVCNYLDKTGAEGLKALVTLEQARKNAGVRNHPRIETIEVPEYREAPAPPGPTWPETVSQWPRLGLAAIRKGHAKGGAWRLWAFARAIDPQGSGTVTRDDLQAFTDHLGVAPSTFRRWLADALRSGLMTQKRRWNGAYILTLAGAARTARTLGLTRGAELDRRRVEIPASLLTAEGWKAWTWAAFIALFDGQPASREKMRELTSVPERTQREWEKAAGIEPLACYAHDENRDKTHLDGVREYDHPNVFTWYDRAAGKFVIAWRLPDIRKAPASFKCGHKGRTRKIRKDLNANSSFLGRAGAAGDFVEDLSRRP